MGLSGAGSTNSPEHLTRLFGREPEARQLEQAVARSRLVTLTGAPGSGKSRLGIEVVRRLAPCFRDGIRLVALARIADPMRVAGALGLVVGVSDRPHQPMVDTIADALVDRELVIVLDNCEHVVGEVASVVRRVIERCPAVRIIATSRLALGVPGEQVWPVAPLEAGPAAELFVDRARLVSGDFRVDAAGEQIGWICDRLDGLPLAIELAAAWTRVLSPAQIADRLDDALPLLTTTARMISPRQQTMEATVAWSYRLLAPAEQTLFARLSVFTGGFDLAAAEAVAHPDDDALAGLTTLVDHSLLQTEPVDGGGMRFRMLEPLRQFGAALLAAGDEQGEVKQRHAEHYLDVARRLDAALRGRRRAAALREMDQEEGNFLVALGASGATDPDLALRLCAALAQFWELRGPVGEWRELIERLLARGPSDQRLRASVQARSARLAWRQRDYRRARSLLEESLGIVERLGDRPAVARRLRTLALVAMSEGDTRAAVELCATSLRMLRQVGDERGVASVLVHLGWAHYIAGDTDAGNEQMGAALAIARAIGYDPVAANSLHGLAYGAQVTGDLTTARRRLVESLDALRCAGMVGGEPSWLWASAALAADEGRWASVARLVGGAEALSQRSGSEINEWFMSPLQPRVDRAFSELGRDVSARLVVEGSRMGLDALLAEAVRDPAAQPPDPLSRREREVVDLVARGLTNTEIAERLFISKRTVESHVDHIKQKLRLRSRSQVIAWALRAADGVRVRRGDRGAAGAAS
jgi:predicted ATPase/DNA-binding CsgD family transcriptional regulator